MIDIYRNALMNESSRANNLVSAAVNAVNQNGGGGSYAPFAAGTPTLGARELAETARSNNMENQYKQQALKETARSNDMQNQTQMAQIAETRRSNDLRNTYDTSYLAETARANDLQYSAKTDNTQETAQQVMSSAMQAAQDAIAKGTNPASVKRNILAQSSQLAMYGINPADVASYVDSLVSANEQAETARLKSRPWYQKAADIFPGEQFR